MPNLYLVGGAVRDHLLNTKTKDLDYIIETTDYSLARDCINSLGCKIVQERPEYGVFRAVHPTRGGIDFALPRVDFNHNGRHSQTAITSSIVEDLARRDFTMNAIALPVDNDLSITGELIDPFNGQQDIQDRLIRFVGSPQERIEEDNLRVLRALRFSITKGFTLEGETLEAITETVINDLVSPERIFEELNKMFLVDNVKTIQLLTETNQLYILNRIKLTAST